jgi:hypothetical protein
MELFEKPSLPVMFDGAVMCVDAKAWNTLIDYVNSQTLLIDNLSHALDKVVQQQSLDTTSIKELTRILKEHLQE